MKTIRKQITAALVSIMLISACRDESLQVVPTWQSAVHGYIEVTDGAQDNFFYKNTTPVGLDFMWNSIDNKLSVVKIDFYVHFNEPYVDKDGNSKKAVHGGTKGKLVKTVSAPPGNRSVAQITISQDEIYQVYKDATFDYDGDGVGTPVFNNPAHPDRVADGRFVEADEFRLTWQLFTDDGRVFTKWGPSVCTEFPNANCQYDWVVVCPFPGSSTFTGSYACEEPGYATYPVAFTLKSGSTTTIVNDNFWDVGASIEYVINGANGTVTIPLQNFSYSGTDYTVSGSGTINNCNGGMSVDYAVKSGGADVDVNTHSFTKN